MKVSAGTEDLESSALGRVHTRIAFLSVCPCSVLVTLQYHLTQVVVIYAVKDFGVINKAEVDAFLELSCFSYDPMNVKMQKDEYS